MGLVEAVSAGISKFWTDKKMFEVEHRVKEEANLPILDWIPYIQQRSTFPPEVQTVKDAPNEDHVKLYDEDIKEITEIRNKSLDLIDREIPDYHYANGFDGTIWMRIKQITNTIASVSGKTGIRLEDLGNRLYYTQNFLYDKTEEVDFASFVQSAYNQYQTLLEESDKNVRIAQKGKTGEDYVSSVLQQYRGRFFYLENIVIPAYGEQGYTSETDVYIISSKGIFVCEVKNYGTVGQTIVMPPNDDWEIYQDNRFLQTKPSAFVQNERHCNATFSFIQEHLKIKVPIIPVVIIANNEVGIVNQTQNAVIRATEIYDFVQGYQDAIDYDTQQQIVDAFETNQLDPNDFPVKLNKDRARYVSGVIEEFIPYLKANQKIADECIGIYKQNRMISKIIVFVIAALCMLTAIKYGSVGVVLTVILLVCTYAIDSKIGIAAGCIGLVCLQIVYVTESPLFLAIAIIGAVINGVLINKSTNK